MSDPIHSDEETTESESGIGSRSAAETPDPLFSVRGLQKHYPIQKGFLRRETGRIRAVDGIDFDLHRGEALGLVGESGCGKSTAARTLVSLETPTAGTIRFDGRDVTEFSKDERKRFRRRVQMVFQDPTSSFDPRMTVGESVAEPMVAHGLADDERRRERVETLLETVGLSAEERERYPHELSGGQKQRAALARALSLNPDVLVLDEPVSALDVSVQAEILALVEDLRETFDLAILLISHDMSVVQQLCDRVAVMYLGELVERAPTADLYDDPKHPYTRALLDAVPKPDPHDRLGEAQLSGDVPDPSDPPSGCRFHTRCPAVIAPSDLDLPQSDWRSVFSLRVDLRNEDLGLETLRERLVAEGKAEVEGPGDVSETAVREAVREEYDVPPELDDETAERSLSAALEELVGGDEAGAEAKLAETFSSVCEREELTSRESDGRIVACHLYESDEFEE
jgi:peptide/nickel transport system ATP-binding protein